MKKIVLIVAFLLLLVRIGSTNAQMPRLPHAFWGTVVVDGAPAPVGTEITAEGANVRTGIPGNPISISVPGQYGAQGAFDPKLVVQGVLEDGTPLQFYVDGSRAQCVEPGGNWMDSYPFESGGVTRLNLRVISATPVPLPLSDVAGGDESLVLRWVAAMFLLAIIIVVVLRRR